MSAYFWARRGSAALATATLALLLSMALAASTGAAPPASAPPKCTIVGTAGNDVLRGTAGADFLCGRGGDDTIRGRGGDDVLVGGAGDDRLFGEAGDDVLITGPGKDRSHGGAGHNVVRKRELKNDRNYQVDVKAFYDLPYGTKVTWKILNGKCTTREYQASFIYDQATRTLITPFYTAIGGNIVEECSWVQSFVRYNVRFESPEGVTKDVNVNVKQTSTPNIYIHAFGVDCEQQTVRCEGTTDSVVAEYGGVPTPTVTFGPLPPKPEPEPTEPPKLSCQDSITVKVNTPLNNLPVCTSTGKPLPALTFNGVMPTSVTASRLNPTSSSVVLNGSFAVAKKYALIVRGKVAAPPWEDEETVLIQVNP